jgi:protein-S-isoprenylcysteine O-methyltransferase Ste14
MVNQTKLNMKENNLNPPFLYKMFILFMIISMLFPLTGKIEFPYNLFGIVLLIAGIYIAASTKKLFKKTQTPMNPEANPVKLHTSGIFRYTRNPMYLGIVVGLTGIALITGNPVNLGFPITYLFLMNKFFIPIEERNLERAYGDQYLAYKDHVRRWI